jgi:hypothetical protein
MLPSLKNKIFSILLVSLIRCFWSGQFDNKDLNLLEKDQIKHVNQM